jgi:hypothetical protein
MILDFKKFKESVNESNFGETSIDALRGLRGKGGGYT